MSRFLQTIRLENFLSFGPESPEIELQSLNVMIGPNTVGKSNLIEAIGLLQATPGDLATAIRSGGPVGEWLWKGGQEIAKAKIEVTVDCPEGHQGLPLRHGLVFTESGQRLEVIDEFIEASEQSDHRQDDVYFYYRYQEGHPVLNVRSVEESEKATATRKPPRKLRREDIASDQSVLSQRKDPEFYPELNYLAKSYSAIQLYREWNVGRDTAPRKSQDPSMPSDFLMETGSNLGLVLNDLQFRSESREKLREALNRFHPGFEDVLIRIHGGSVQLFLKEKGLREPIPATRLSDGTLRYLCLIAVLCHPNPPPIVCIEEPELALHPDIVPFIGELLIEASRKTQLIVTTHSDALVSELSQDPASVLICERGETGTELRRLDSDAIEEWLDKYTLGDLWRMGELGGTAP